MYNTDVMVFKIAKIRDQRQYWSCGHSQAESTTKIHGMIWYLDYPVAKKALYRRYQLCLRYQFIITKLQVGPRFAKTTWLTRLWLELMTANSGGFSFPVASLTEIVSVVHEWGLDDVQQTQISGCDPMVIQRIYAVAVQRVTGISLETLDNKTEQLVTGLDEYGVI